MNTEGNSQHVVLDVVLRCPICERSLKVPLLNDKVLVVKCPRGCGTFDFDCRKYISRQRFRKNASTISIVILLCVVIVLPFILWEVLGNKLQKATQNYDSKLARLEEALSEERQSLKIKYAVEVAAIDSSKLAKQAAIHYAALWKDRSNYLPRYALTGREKALLEMQALARDPTKSERDRIRQVAIKASPKHSRVVVSQTSLGFRLSVDFDMSELTTGEKGTRTKHSTIASLKKEVIRLTSKVANDMYQSCGHLGLKTISIGCRHFVDLTNKDGSKAKESNIVIYKAKLNAADFGELRHNPYLDTYSITARFKVELDEFSTLKIRMTTYEK